MRGDLDTIALAELCVQLSDQGMSGTLVLQSPHGEGQVSFSDGNIIWARSPSRTARIGDRLVHSGLLDPYYVDQAAQAQREAPAGTGIAAVLVDRGLISADAARVFLQEQMLDAISDMLAWREGTFELSTEPPPVIRLAISVQTERLLTEVRRRLEEQQTVRATVHSLDLVPARTLDEPDELALGEAAVLRAIDGSKTIEDLGTELGFSDNELRRIVYGLTMIGAVDLSSQKRPAEHKAAESELDATELAIADSLDEVLTRLTGSDEPEPEAIDAPEPEAIDQQDPEGISEADPEPSPHIDSSTEHVEAFDPEPAAEPGPLGHAEPMEAAEPEQAASEPDDADLESETAEPVRSDHGSAIGDPTAVHEDEPRPWVGYANAKAARASERSSTSQSPGPGDAATWDVPSTPVVAGTDAATDQAEAPAENTDLPVHHRTRSEAASWLAAVSDATDPEEDQATSQAAEPPQEPTPVVDDRASSPAGTDLGSGAGEPEYFEAAEEEEPSEDGPASSSPPSGDDLSALLAELSSLSTEEDTDEPTAPPPRKPGGDSRQSGDSKRKRLFGR